MNTYHAHDHNNNKNSPQIFGSSHNHKLNGTLISKHIVRPLADGPDGLDGGNAIVGNEDLFDDTPLATAKDADVLLDRIETSVEIGGYAAAGRIGLGLLLLFGRMKVDLRHFYFVCVCELPPTFVVVNM